jgi:hypothetical protein
MFGKLFQRVARRGLLREEWKKLLLEACDGWLRD